MTKEEEAIKILSDSNILFNIQKDTALSIRVAIETALDMINDLQRENKSLIQTNRSYKGMIRKKDKEIESLKKAGEATEEVYKGMIKKKDKQIDLIAKYINYLSDELVQATGRNELEFCNGNKCCIDSDYSCEQCIKQYFKQKATNNG